MALITCPECGKEISDKSTSCVHCGFPLNVAESGKNEISIVGLFRNYASNVSVGYVSSIFSEVMQAVNQIKQSYSEQEAADLIAKEIIDGLSLIPNHTRWMDAKLFCEIIDYKALSAKGMDYFTDQLYSILSIKHFYNDGSGGYCYIGIFFYPTYMVIHHGSEDNKAKLMTILGTSYCNTNRTWYDEIVSEFKQKGSGNTLQQIETTQSTLQGIKCPVCGSTRVNKISTANRAISVLAWGFASSKIGKQYECKNCKHKW